MSSCLFLVVVVIVNNFRTTVATSIYFTNASNVTIDASGALLLNGEIFHIKGVCWNPTPNRTWNAPNFTHYVVQDADLMQAYGINTVRTYTPIDDLYVLDELYKRNIYGTQNKYIHTIHSYDIVSSR